ncbi:tyrosine-type recombinase/integrase [Streptomyces nojiriensis]|uniref:tyrosine-type recombinase/integrase n=1 Tax=Streptomyces nojiriensis TaxID=66374 RepID=UPI00399C3D7C
MVRNVPCRRGGERIPGDYLFSDVGGTNILMYSLVDRLWRRAKQSAGITRTITPHWLRHFFASAGLSKGVPVTDMAEWLGHSGLTPVGGPRCDRSRPVGRIAGRGAPIRSARE